MSVVDFILAGYAIVLTFGGMVHFLVGRTQSERMEHRVDVAENDLAVLKAQPSNADLSAEFVELHRKLTELQTVTSNQELRLSDVNDTLEHRFNRLRMRQARARQEGEEEEPQVDPETAQQLLMELNGAPVQEEQQQPHRGRLVPRHRRDNYRRR